MEKIRLHKLIAHYGYTSRRKAEDLIRNNRVRVNGEIVNTVGTKVNYDSIIEIDGKIINKKVKRIYIALYKPAGYVCTKSDEYGRKTIFELIDKKYLKYGLFNVGRLDLNSKGLIILTNDGNFANYIMHPSNNVYKEYIVITDKNVTPELIEPWKRGVVINNNRYKIVDYNILSNKKVSLILNEGKKREIRILFRSIGLNVLELLRIRIGNIKLNNLKEGEYRFLSDKEIKSIFSYGQ